MLDALTPVVEVKSLPTCSTSLQHCFFFFSFQVFLSEVLLCLDRKEYGGLSEARAFLVKGSVWGSLAEKAEAWELAMVVWARRLPWGQR